jgi:hypothetical protein
MGQLGLVVLVVSEPMIRDRPSSKTDEPSETPIRSEKNFWTIKDAARYLNVGAGTIYDWLNADNKKPKPAKLSKLTSLPPHFRFGSTKCIRFPIKEFIRWAENFRQE